MVNLLLNYLGYDFGCVINGPIITGGIGRISGGGYNIPEMKSRTVNENVGKESVSVIDVTLPKVDGRKKDHSILKYAKTSGKSECLNGDGTCSPSEMLSIVSYFVKKKTEQNPKLKAKYHEGKGSAEKNLESAKKILKCDTESCVLTNREFLSLVTNENMVSVKDIKEVLDKFFKPPGDTSNNPQTGSSSTSIAHVLKHWSTLFKDFCPIIPILQNVNIIVDIRDLPTKEMMGSFNLIKSIELHPQFKRYGFVLNNQIDNIEMGHAVVLFIDITEHPEDGGAWTIEFYNSHGTTPEKYIAQWMTKTANLLKIYRQDKYGNDNVKSIVVSNIVTQGNSYECALHSLFYIKCRLEGVPYQFFRKNIAPSDAMIQFRKHVFRDHKYQIF